MAEQLHHRNLPVPFLSQRKNTYVFKGTYEGDSVTDFVSGEWHDNDDHLRYDENGDKEVSMANRSCNITCIAMLLHYFGITPDTSHTLETPDAMMRNYFTSLADFATLADRKLSRDTYKSVMALEVWDTMKQFVKIKYGQYCTPELYTGGACTIQTLKDNIAAGYPTMISIGIKAGKSGGHIVVVRGFTEIGGVEYIILNDPWGHATNIESSTSWYNYDNVGDDGDNVVLTLTEFRKIIGNKLTINTAMVIRASLWQEPDGTEISGIDANALFPMNSDSMWHSGIHLSGFPSREIRSIGAGRLLAVRNSDATNGSASFMLVKHQVAKLTGEDKGTKIGKILPFYALYMHTDSINIKYCAEIYFKTGRLPDQYNYKWLLQLFSSMLPHVYVIANADTRKNMIDLETGKTLKDSEGNILTQPATTGGQMNGKYESQKIYEAGIIENSGLGKTIDDVGNMIQASKEFHGRRMLVHLLPVTGLFQKLLNPANYSNPSFRLEMLDPSNFVKTGTIGAKDTKYIFFHSHDASTDIAESTEIERVDPEIFCSIVDANFFEKSTTVNGKVFNRNAEKLSQLYKKEVVSFNDLVNLPVPRHIALAPITYLNGKAHDLAFTSATTVTGFLSLSGTAFLAEQKAHWNGIFESRKTDNVSMTDNFFTGMEEISLDLVLLYKDSKNSDASIYNRLNEYFNGHGSFQGYKDARDEALKSFLDTITPRVSTKQAAVTDTWRHHLRKTLNDCFYKITPSPKNSDYNPPFANVKDDTGGGDDIANTFVDRLEKLYLPVGYAEMAIEMACCRLCNIPLNEIAPTAPDTTATCFTTGDRSIGKLLERYSALLTAIFNSFNMSYQHYVDTVIEIPKNDIIGKCGRYNDEMDMIHFEIFSAKGVNIYTELGIATKGSIVDTSKKDFFNPSHTIEKLQTVIKSASSTFSKTRADKYIMDEDEFNKLKESDIPSKYTFEHISEWSPTLTYAKFEEWHPKRSRGDLSAHIRTDREIKSVQATDKPSHFENEDYAANVYFEKCAVPYQWSLEKVLGKSFFTNDFHIYYHPTYFLAQLIEKFNPPETT